MYIKAMCHFTVSILLKLIYTIATQYVNKRMFKCSYLHMPYKFLLQSFNIYTEQVLVFLQQYCLADSIMCT